MLLLALLMFFWLFSVIPFLGRFAYKVFVTVSLFIILYVALSLYVIIKDGSVKEVIIDLAKGIVELRYKAGLEILSVRLKPPDIKSVELEEKGKNLYLSIITNKGIFTITTKYNQYTKEEILNIYKLINKLRTHTTK